MNAFKPIGICSLLAALAILSNSGVTRACDADTFNERGCAWPLALSPVGPADIQAPDSASRYWIMPFDTERYQAMTITGTYPSVRYFSIVAYDEIKTPEGHTFEVADHIYDADIIPDEGSTNPFVSPGGGSGTYTVVVSREDSTLENADNAIKVGAESLAWVALRLYVPSADPALSGKSLMGGVPLPTITLTNNASETKPLQPCSQVEPWSVNKWSDLSAYSQYIFPSSVDVIGTEGTPLTDRLWFASPAKPPAVLWPNPDAKYMLMMPGDEYQAGRIIVIHGKSPGFPDTFNGSPIWEPARGFRSVDVRYWALCLMNLAPPVPVVDCATDFTTRLRGKYYTIVISDDRQRPEWLNRNINWLPWGDEEYPKFMAFRHIIPSPEFQYSVEKAWADPNCKFDFEFPTVPDRTLLDDAGPYCKKAMGQYYPVALWCDKETFLSGGFRACLNDGH